MFMVIQVNQHLFLPMILSKKITLFAAVACLTTTLPAGVVVADFNDLPLGIMHFDKSKSPPLVESGIGFSDAAWMGATTITHIVDEDLTPPPSVNYRVEQIGPKRSFRAPLYSILETGERHHLLETGDRRNGRGLASELVGPIWISFLVKNEASDQAAGIDFNNRPPTVITPIRSSIVVEGSDLRILSFGNNMGDKKANVASLDSAAQGIKKAKVAPLGSAALILVSMNTKSKGYVNVWVNPDLSRGSSSLGEPVIKVLYSDFLGSARSIMSIGIQSYGTEEGASQIGGILDSVRLADGADAFQHVTGIRAK